MEKVNVNKTEWRLATAYGWLGREAEAKAEAAEIPKLVPDATVKSALAGTRNYSDNPVFFEQRHWRKAGLPQR